MKKKKEIQDNKAQAKLNTDKDNYRNRLFKWFQNNILKKDGALPSPDKGLVQLVLRTWSKLRYGKDASEKTRDRVVTVGLSKVLHDYIDVPNQALSGDIMTQKFLELSNYVAKVKVLATLLANFICLEQLTANEDLPCADAKFYSACLAACSSRKCGHDSVHEAFNRFCTSTGNTALPRHSGVTTLFERQVRTAFPSYFDCFITD